jgi:hypothetical protein
MEWWNREGSAMTPSEGEDMAEFVCSVAAVAWAQVLIREAARNASKQSLNPAQISLRDHFAGKAMQTLAAYEEYPPERAADRAYAYADAMLIARDA